MTNISKSVVHDFKYPPRHDNSDKASAYGQDIREGMPIIRCFCGAKMLVVPDLNAMNRAIENHIVEHKKMDRSNGKQRISPSKLRQFLIGQILATAGLTNA